MQQLIYTHILPNGMTLLAERLPHVRSAAFSFMVRAGGAYDPVDKLGLSGLLTDLITRGAGELDSRQFSDALDNLGVDRSESTGGINLHFGGVTLATNLTPALKLYADLLQRPHFPEEELEAVQALAIQDIQNLEDEPQSKVMVELRKNYYPDPLGRDQRGTEAGIEVAKIEDVRQHYAKHFHPSNVILAVAGDINWDMLRKDVETLFGGWKEQTPTAYPISPLTGLEAKYVHLQKDLDQTQIALIYPSVPLVHPDNYLARAAVGVLSLDMSSRLFMEVREKYGLCYSVYASYEAFQDRGSILAYAGSRPEKAQETFDRTLHELKRLPEGIEEEELQRVKVGLKASLIMRQESTGARVSSLTSDWYYLGRIRTLAEIQQAIDELNVSAILDHVKRFPPKGITVVTLGPQPLKV
ncbi:insulinase family protein [Telmatocola sphagniphila]|uniref:Insulinase family protein n=1 Tax=Telmatocola sphagniphila TaxID=1123043 RepID=A0A8E6EW85_9BACT|nr:pitrilysin family protein [Telmatocola sphagniphila]QVL29861.1 insulinase family protein [Telmatocola sphagniphila]